MRRCLKGCGIAAHKENGRLVADLAQEKDLVISVQNGKLTVSVALADAENRNIWFSSESKCESNAKFMSVFDAMFKDLLAAVMNFVTVHNEVSRRSVPGNMSTKEIS